MIETLNQQDAFPVAALCEILGVSRSAWYAWQQESDGPQRRTDRQLRPLIRDVFHEHRRRYGARRIVAELADRDQPTVISRPAAAACGG